MARSIRSFAFFVVALLALVNATPSVSHGFISAIDRQTSPYFLSFRADLTDIMPLANGVNVYYSIGISAGSAEVLAWTQINTPQAVNTIVETFATPLPDDYAIYINVKTVDTNNGNAETVYSSASLKVGNRLSSDPTCAAIFNPVGTSTVSPPQPAITIEYDNTQQLFHFEIGAKYLLQGYTWVIDFAPFTGDYTKGTKGLAATNCENRQTADLTGRNFAEFWNAAPAADYTGALNSKNYLAYRIGSASPKWTVTSDGCDKVTYTTPGFSFADLLSCKQADGTTPSIIRTIVGNSIQYNGTLYVTAVKAVNPLDHTAGFQTVQFTMPFFVSFSVSSTSISSGTDNNIFAFSISSLYIQADGNLAMSLATNAMNNGFYLTNPSVDSEPNNVDLAATTPTPSNIQQQIWTFKTSTPVTDYSGTYAISFTRTDGTATQTVTAQFTLSLSVSSSYNNNGLVLPTVLSFWGSNAFTGQSEKTVYTSLDTIFVKSTVTIQNNQDLNTYANSIYNVWLCYTVDGSTPVYNPTNNQLGCTAQTWNIRPLSRLVFNGQVTTGVLEDQFSTTIYNAINGLASVNSGVSFSAAPLATLRTGAFWIQIEAKINLPAKKRTLLAEQASSHEIQAFSISADATTDVPKTPIASSASVAQVCTAAVALFGGLLML